MPSINIASANRSSNPFLSQPFLFDDTYQADECFPHLPFLSVAGPFLRALRINIPDAAALGNSGGVAVTPNATDGQDLTTPPGSQASIAYNTVAPPPEFYIKRVIGDVLQSSFLRFNFSAQNPQLDHQVTAKLLAIRYEYSRMFIQGVGGGENDPEFLGLAALAALTPSQNLLGTGNIPNDLDALLSRIRSANGRADFILMNFVTHAVYSQQMRAAGVEPQAEWDSTLGRRVLHHGGVPIWRSQFIPTDAMPSPPTFSAQIFAGVLGYPDGLVGLFQEGVGQNGIQIEPCWFSPDRDNSTTRVSAQFGLALLTSSGLAGVT